jgi:transposase
MFPTFGWFLLLALVSGMIRCHDPHRRHPGPRRAVASHPATATDPTTPLRRPPRVDDRAALAGIVYQLRSGIPWRLLPTAQLGCGSAITCWRRLRDWQRAGVFEQLHHQLLDQLGRDSRLDWSRASLDSLSVRAKRGAS